LARQKQNSPFAKVQGEVAPYDFQLARNPKIGAKALDSLHKQFAPYVKRIVVSGASLWPSTAVIGAMGQAVQGLFTGQTDVTGVLKAADNAWDSSG